MAQSKKNRRFKFFLIIVIIFSVLAILTTLGFYCWQKVCFSRISTSQESENNLLKPTLTPAQTVETFLKLTLASLPNSNVDYVKAKGYVVPEKVNLIVNPTFQNPTLPKSYQVANGPKSYSIISEVAIENEALVKVKGEFYTAPKEVIWKFRLSLASNRWKISEIEKISEK